METPQQTAKPIKKRVGEEAKIIGQNLRRLRKLHGVSQRDIAAHLDTSFQKIQKYEKGQNRISAEKLHRLKIFFDVPYGVFFEGLKGGGITQSSDKILRTLSSRLSRFEDKQAQRIILSAFLTISSCKISSEEF